MADQPFALEVECKARLGRRTMRTPGLEPGFRIGLVVGVGDAREVAGDLEVVEERCNPRGVTGLGRTQSEPACREGDFHHLPPSRVRAA